MRTLRVALLTSLTLGFAQSAGACTPPPWTHGPSASSPAAYAETLLARASTVIYGRVRKVDIVGQWQDRRGFVEIELIESFKGPTLSDGIYTVHVGLCTGGPYELDMRRLFVLDELRDGKGNFVEIYGWQTPKHPEEQLMMRLRLLKNATQPNPRVESDALARLTRTR